MSIVLILVIISWHNYLQDFILTFHACFQESRVHKEFLPTDSGLNFCLNTKSLFLARWKAESRKLTSEEQVPFENHIVWRWRIDERRRRPSLGRLICWRISPAERQSGRRPPEVRRRLQRRLRHRIPQMGIADPCKRIPWRLPTTSLRQKYSWILSSSFRFVHDVELLNKLLRYVQYAMLLGCLCERALGKIFVFLFLYELSHQCHDEIYISSCREVPPSFKDFLIFVNRSTSWVSSRTFPPLWILTTGVRSCVVLTTHVVKELFLTLPVPSTPQPEPRTLQYFPSTFTTWNSPDTTPIRQVIFFFCILSQSRSLGRRVYPSVYRSVPRVKFFIGNQSCVLNLKSRRVLI